MNGSDDSLQVSRLSTGYRRYKVLQNVSLPMFRAGEIYSLVGPNAAGKSTLMRALAGLQPATGSVRLQGCELIGRPLAEWSRCVTYMPQSLPQGVALSVLESVISALRASPTDETDLQRDTLEQRAVDVLERVGIVEQALESLNHLSGGQRQLVSLAQVLARKPRVLLLDEPISALDLHYQLRVMRLVHELARERRMIVLMVLHDLDIAARWSDGIVMLSRGGVAATGTPAEAITSETLARVYGVRASVDQSYRGTLHIMIEDVLDSEEAKR